jgi:hypothetical protein
LLRWIDNNSGHYHPEAKQVQQALKMLHADGADLTRAIAAVGVYNGPNGALNAMNLYEASEMLDDGPDVAQPFKIM